ncbi:hypothetical protein [Deinococcus pimensis]|uniref:hypothetical protein n=1 Tax=Deinococcus pimensis TaxID=309888 RepID=UPI00048817E6|nr:hypothetical protein [Deinococcus pimensis]
MLDDIAELNQSWRSSFVGSAYRARVDALEAAGLHFRWEVPPHGSLRFSALDAEGEVVASQDAWVGATKEMLVSLVLERAEARFGTVSAPIL